MAFEEADVGSRALGQVTRGGEASGALPTIPAPAWGLSTTIDLYRCDPETLRSAERIVAFTHQLCDILQVTRFGETQVVRFGEDPRICGYSMVQLIETSLVSAHFAETSNAIYLDIFSCKWYDADAAAAFAKEFFGATRVRVSSRARE